MPSTSTDSRQALTALEQADRLLVQQVFKPIANEYRISIPAPGSSEEGPPLLYVKQKRMKIKEDIRFRLSPDDEEHLFMIKSKSVFEFRGRHEVLDAEGAVIGMLEKDFAPLAAAQPLARARRGRARRSSRRTRRAGSSRWCDGSRSSAPTSSRS